MRTVPYKSKRVPFMVSLSNHERNRFFEIPVSMGTSVLLIEYFLKTVMEAYFNLTLRIFKGFWETSMLIDNKKYYLCI